MIANLLNVVVGLWLVHISIFGAPSFATAPWLIIALGVAVIALAAWARSSDFSGWQSGTNMVIGGIVVLVSLVERVVAISALALFWIDLWAGVTVASLALWAVLYKPEPSTSADALT